MSQNLKTQEQWTAHALNVHGSFFERKCSAIVDGLAEWTVVSRNYPIEYPLPRAGVRGKESALDIRARSTAAVDGFMHDIQIECKKANPDFVNWIFFPTESSAGLQIATASVLQANGDAPWQVQRGVLNAPISKPVASEAREVRGSYLDYKNQKDKTKTANAAIQEASYQVALANRAVVEEDANLFDRESATGSNEQPNWVRRSYLPLIVTTARLFYARFDVDRVSLTTGEIPVDAVKFEDVKTVIYQYSVPKHLQHSLVSSHPLSDEQQAEAVSRLSIFVVQAESLASFLADLRG